MKNRYLFSLFILISIPMNLLAQSIKDKDHYTYQVREESGDLNNDGKMDKITVKMDTVDETRPLNYHLF